MDFMELAIKEAEKARAKGEVPIGCVIVKDGKVVAVGRNMRERKRSATAHAEIVAITKACKKLRSWRLTDCEMYVTLEPCQMCLGAAVNARIKKVYAGARSTTDLNWQTNIEFTDNARCSAILVDFFKEKR